MSSTEEPDDPHARGRVACRRASVPSPLSRVSLMVREGGCSLSSALRGGQSTLFNINQRPARSTAGRIVLRGQGVTGPRAEVSNRRASREEPFPDHEHLFPASPCTTTCAWPAQSPWSSLPVCRSPGSFRVEGPSGLLGASLAARRPRSRAEPLARGSSAIWRSCLASPPTPPSCFSTSRRRDDAGGDEEGDRR